MTSIPPEIERKINQLQSHIEQADALEHAWLVDEAEAAYHACLQMAARERIPLLAGQLAQIWMGIGFCYADRNDWLGALGWYYRAEATLLSAPVFNPNPTSPEAQANDKKWSPYVPKEVTVIFQQSYPAEAHLAALCDSIALAYDNVNQLERAKEYYQRSIGLHVKLGNPASEAEVWSHQALGCQRRQQWLDLEQVAGSMLLAAERVQAKALMLSAQRFLAQSQINQNRPFKTLEHLCRVVVLARELNDVKLATDEGFLRDLVRSLRPDVLQRSQADLLLPIAYAETILNDPNLAQDMALLRNWQHRQPSTIQPGSKPEGPLTSLSEAAMMLEHFALRHCGKATQKEKRAKKGLMRILSGATEVVERRVWAITQEELQIYQKDHQDQIAQRQTLCAVLTLFGQPEVIINVSLTSSECNVRVMEQRALPGDSLTGFFTMALESIPLQSEALLSCLNSFIQRGLFVQTDKGLQYISPKPP